MEHSVLPRLPQSQGIPLDHYVPHFILKKFYMSERLGEVAVLDKTQPLGKRNPKPFGPGKLMALPAYDSPEYLGNTFSVDFDKRFEHPAAPVIDELCNARSTAPLRDGHKLALLVSFLCAQAIRQPMSAHTLLRKAKLVRSAIDSMDIDAGERAAIMIWCNSIPSLEAAYFDTLSMASDTDHFMQAFVGCAYVLVEASQERFVIGDCPYIEMANLGPEASQVSKADRTIRFMPISPTLTLMAFGRFWVDRVVRASSASAASELASECLSLSDLRAIGSSLISGHPVACNEDSQSVLSAHWLNYVQTVHSVKQIISDSTDFKTTRKALLINPPETHFDILYRNATPLGEAQKILEHVRLEAQKNKISLHHKVERDADGNRVVTRSDRITKGIRVASYRGEAPGFTELLLKENDDSISITVPDAAILDACRFAQSIFEEAGSEADKVFQAIYEQGSIMYWRERNNILLILFVVGVFLMEGHSPFPSQDQSGCPSRS